MEIYEIKLSLKLNKMVPLREYANFVSKNINYILYNSIILRAIHDKRGFKPYVVGSLSPIEEIEQKSKIYQKDKFYLLTIRTISKAFAQEFIDASKKAYNLEFKILNAKYKKLHLSYIDRLYTITPAVLTITQNNQKPRYWTIEDDIFLLQRRIKDNLEKKYKEFFKKDIKAPQDMIYFFGVDNQKPIVYNYKGGKIFANRLTVGFNSDEVSQKLASLSFGVGILEKNPLGFGMVVRGRGET